MFEMTFRQLARFCHARNKRNILRTGPDAPFLGPPEHHRANAGAPADEHLADAIERLISLGVEFPARMGET